MRLFAAIGLILAACLPHAAQALPPGNAPALVEASRSATALAEPVRRNAYRSYYRSNFRGGWSRRYGTIHRAPSVPRWLNQR